MSLSQAMKAVRDAQDCVKVGQFDTARALIDEASRLVRPKATRDQAYDDCERLARCNELEVH